MQYNVIWTLFVSVKHFLHKKQIYLTHLEPRKPKNLSHSFRKNEELCLKLDISLLGFPAKLVLFRITRNTKRNEFRYFAKQTRRLAKFRFEAKQAVSHFSVFFIWNETVHFAYFVTGTLTLRPWMSVPVWYVPCTIRPEFDVSLVRCVPCKMLPLRNVAPGWCVLWMMCPLNDASLGLGHNTRRPLRERWFIFSFFVHSVPNIQGHFLLFHLNRFNAVLYEPSEPWVFNLDRQFETHHRPRDTSSQGRSGIHETKRNFNLHETKRNLTFTKQNEILTFRVSRNKKQAKLETLFYTEEQRARWFEHFLNTKFSTMQSHFPMFSIFFVLFIFFLSNVEKFWQITKARFLLRNILTP
jgi:hypothetical protein